jgi:hypothetical protein
MAHKIRDRPSERHERDSATSAASPPRPNRPICLALSLPARRALRRLRVARELARDRRTLA